MLQALATSKIAMHRDILRMVIQSRYFVSSIDCRDSIKFLYHCEMLQISNNVFIPERELEFTAIRAQGPGGQNVNKVSTAIQLRFDIHRSSLPDFYKQRLLRLSDQRISREGVIVIKAQSSRSQEQNRLAAMERLQSLIRSVAVTRKKRIATRPGKAAKKRRLEAKTRRGKIKAGRQRVEPD